MALQSSGQIKLSEIAAEFGGSAPHALSEYYGAASGVPASGQIKLGADFYGTSNSLSLSTTITTARQELKTAAGNDGFISSSGRTVGTTNDNANGTTTTIGSIGNNNITNGGIVEAFYENYNVGTVEFNFEMSTASTSWTKITLTNPAATYNRTDATTSDNQLFVWTSASTGQSGISENSTIGFVIS
jgi:hypothetical protein